MMVGEFIAHLEDLDGHTDASGRLLQELAESIKLVLSATDYCLFGESLYESLQGMVIDEDRAGNLASDHRRIQLAFQNGFRR
ncbi:hypothetical protein HPB50_008568 [Hyalomma asiaticum]|uniref:Uncharacterized protein n=1 Tax=Hyalomma asiaticum TaxID=266040 RepID=A0ACB7RTH7_HYAAI|nr:hypothetical protein HPB50_008568 [Hyalomma asiaticum]